MILASLPPATVYAFARLAPVEVGDVVEFAEDVLRVDRIIGNWSGAMGSGPLVNLRTYAGEVIPHVSLVVEGAR